MPCVESGTYISCHSSVDLRVDQKVHYACIQFEELLYGLGKIWYLTVL